jgi:hypothetical protein
MMHIGVFMARIYVRNVDNPARGMFAGAESGEIDEASAW